MQASRSGLTIITIRSIVGCLCFAASIRAHQFLPLLPFHHHQNHLPAGRHQVQTAIIHDQQQQPTTRATSTANRFQLLHPAFPPQNRQTDFLPPFLLNPPLYTAVRNALIGGNGVIHRGRFFAPPLNNLFTPNTVKHERPESEGQDEEYRKFLEEEAEELEKDRYHNDITRDFPDFSLDSIKTTSFEPNKKTFVRVNIQGKDYSYAA
ncbi:uncharacterized protein [Euwallacea fornicatus]|uniref:uncharacterized protein isoform X2 n=1 Tax=Euwallacea fornicatus TaxID=995702 RepID=UPI00338F4E89